MVEWAIGNRSGRGMGNMNGVYEWGKWEYGKGIVLIGQSKICVLALSKSKTTYYTSNNFGPLLKSKLFASIKIARNAIFILKLD